jgi:hypothetical protein
LIWWPTMIGVGSLVSSCGVAKDWNVIWFGCVFYGLFSSFSCVMNATLYGR